MCYTETMDTDRHIWQVWSAKLQRWGLADWAAEILEAAGPLAVIGAQFVYLGQPLFSQFWAWNDLDAVARVLESPSGRSAFVQLLRDDGFTG